MSPHIPCIQRRIDLLESHLSYQERGPADAPAVLFLHGNPTSSHIWRNVIPPIAATHRCLAPDLIGFGQSGKPDIDYRLVDHIRYLEAFLDALALRSFHLVAQDWGTALAFHLAARFPERVRGLAFMEFIRPMADWSEFHQEPQARTLFQRFRTPGVGEHLIQEENLFIERVLPGSILRTLTPEEWAAYRAPFPTVASRRPIWRFPNELPVAGSPADVHALLTAAYEALKVSTYPKLLFVGDPGALVSPHFARALVATLANARLVELGAGRHYLQEDHGPRIGREVAGWLQGL